MLVASIIIKFFGGFLDNKIEFLEISKEINVCKYTNFSNKYKLLIFAYISRRFQRTYFLYGEIRKSPKKLG